MSGYGANDSKPVSLRDIRQNLLDAMQFQLSAGATAGATFLAKTQKPRKTLGFSGFPVAAEGLEPPTRGL